MDTKRTTTELLPSTQLLTYACSTLRNSTNDELYKTLDAGPIQITRYNKQPSVLLSAELYDRLVDKISRLKPQTKP